VKSVKFGAASLRIGAAVEEEMRLEYDIRGGAGGKRCGRYQEGTNVVLLEAHAAAVVGDSESVSPALQLFIEVARDQVPAGSPKDSKAYVGVCGWLFGSNGIHAKRART
jgi:hypothetical protein